MPKHGWHHLAAFESLPTSARCRKMDGTIWRHHLATETFGDVDPALLPEVHRFEVPDGCH